MDFSPSSQRDLYCCKSTCCKTSSAFINRFIFYYITLFYSFIDCYLILAMSKFLCLLPFMFGFIKSNVPFILLSHSRELNISHIMFCLIGYIFLCYIFVDMYIP